MTPRHSFAILLAAAGLLAAPVASAQENANIPEIAAEDVTQGQVVSFINAMIAVDRVRQEYMPRIEAAETDDERQALAQEADSAARTAVDDTAGITAQEYLAIGRAAQADEDLAKRINERFVQLRQKKQQQLQVPEDEAE